MSNLSILASFVGSFSESYEALPPRGPVTVHQKALLLIWITMVSLWIYRQFIGNFLERKRHQGVDEEHDLEKQPTEIVDKPTANPNHVSFDDALVAAIIVGCIMFYYFFCDYLHYFAKADRSYNRDLFMFLCLLLAVIAIYFTSVESSVPGKLLNREQTEEWKGWMQILFVWYHYFRATETYNAIRIYIAAYVWMTGFGNFSFFWVKKDYALRRVLKMLFRLNFLVVITTLVTDNQYILYYICAMHTFWFLSVYTMMRPFSQYNGNKKVMTIKFCLYFITIFSIFNIPHLADTVFSPFYFILKYDNSLHEWIFRSKLDHCVTFIGMLCAYFHPTAEKLLNQINGHHLEKPILAAISTLLFLILGTWYQHVFVLGKYNYNKIHPYTSFIPILAFIFLRNSTAWLRRRHLALFAFLGKITLETYISQLHIYLQANANNLLVYIPNYPLLNFVVNSVVYLCMSQCLFHSTIKLNEYVFPNDFKKMLKNIVLIACSVIASYMMVAMSTLLG